MTVEVRGVLLSATATCGRVNTHGSTVEGCNECTVATHPAWGA